MEKSKGKMRKLIFGLMCTISFNSFAAFTTSIHIGKGETKEFTVTGLYDPFYYPMQCDVRTPDFRSIPTNGGSSYILIVLADGKASTQQINWDCHDSYHCRRDGSITGPYSPIQVYNGFTFRFINKPDYSLDVTCKTS